MFNVNKIISDPVVDFAAEELKKYLLMMTMDMVLLSQGCVRGMERCLVADTLVLRPKQI